jgi:monooxygenase
VIVTATGLNLLPLGGIDLAVDGEPVVVSERMAYKGMMLAGVPNAAFTIGYTNASWTLKIDLVCAYVARMLRFMRDHRYASVTPRPPAGMPAAPLIEMSSGYFERSRGLLPLQGDRTPWRLHQHYFRDVQLFKETVQVPELEFRAVPELARRAG